MADKKIHAIKPDAYTTTPDKGFFTLGGNASTWFHGTGHFYKTAENSSSNNILYANDDNSFNSQYDNDHREQFATGNPCSNDGFEVFFKTNTNTPGYLTAVIATGSRNNLKDWGRTYISDSDQSNCMQNICGCTFVSDNTSSDDSNSPRIYVHRVGFLYRNKSGQPFVYTLYQPLDGVNHWNTSHERSRMYQGGQLHYNRDLKDLFFHGIIIEYWSVKNSGTSPRGFSHKIKNLKFMVRGDNKTNPTTSTSRGSDYVVLQRGDNTHKSDIKIYTS